ncbi:MAG: low molecular weight phosphotyrosine protein phosphatase [Opitutales bacterium]|nr:low molecular weight phosphotyrosine protein phosphatase [Opitutales bacterium]
MTSYRVLFVCMGNICRSPAAECVFRHYVAQTDLDGRVLADSAGTIGYHEGDPPDARMQRELRQRSIQVSGRARAVTKGDFQEFDLILAMDEQNLENLRNLGGAAATPDRLRLFGDFCQQHPGTEVPDPYYGGSDGFAHVVDMLEDGMPQLLAHIRESLEKRG